MNCPFCKQELRKIHPTYVICDTCRITGEDKLWQELIATRKALDKAVWWLNEIIKNHRFTPISTAENALIDIKTYLKAEKIADEAIKKINEITKGGNDE